MSTEAPRMCLACSTYHGSVNAERLCLEALVVKLGVELANARSTIAVLVRLYGHHGKEGP